MDPRLSPGVLGRELEGLVCVLRQDEPVLLCHDPLAQPIADFVLTEPPFLLGLFHLQRFRQLFFVVGIPELCAFEGPGKRSLENLGILVGALELRISRAVVIRCPRSSHIFLSIARLRSSSSALTNEAREVDAAGTMPTEQRAETHRPVEDDTAMTQKGRIDTLSVSIRPLRNARNQRSSC